MANSPWQTPFGRLLIISSIVAGVLGFVVALGTTGYFESMGDSTEASLLEGVAEAEVRGDQDLGPVINIPEDGLAKTEQGSELFAPDAGDQGLQPRYQDTDSEPDYSATDPAPADSQMEQPSGEEVAE